MKKPFLLIFLLLPAIIYSQNSYEFFFRITDSVIVKKDYPYATKINLEISVPDFQYAFFIYDFPKCVASHEWSAQRKEFFDSQGVNSIAPRILQYVIIDENNEIIEYSSDYFSLLCKYLPIDTRFERMSTFVNSKQKILRKKLKLKKRFENNLAKYEINNQKQNVTLYLLLSVYHHDLPKGEYWLYLTYRSGQSFYSTSVQNNVVSNKVKLIVE